MDSIIKSFSIGDLLRNLFSGIFFVISYSLVACNPQRVISVDAVSIFTLGVPIGLFAGVVIYGFHRSLFYPFLEWIFNLISVKKFREKVPLISKNSMSIILWRWEQSKFPDDINLSKINSHLNRWADYIHFQYTSSFCTLAGIIFGLIIKPSCSIMHLALLLFISLLLLIAAFVSDWRLHSFIDHVQYKKS
jgi:hypothetical protein